MKTFIAQIVPFWMPVTSQHAQVTENLPLVKCSLAEELNTQINRHRVIPTCSTKLDGAARTNINKSSSRMCSPGMVEFQNVIILKIVFLMEMREGYSVLGTQNILSRREYFLSAKLAGSTNGYSSWKNYPSLHNNFTVWSSPKRQI